MSDFISFVKTESRIHHDLNRAAHEFFDLSDRLKIDKATQSSSLGGDAKKMAVEDLAWADAGGKRASIQDIQVYYGEAVQNIKLAEFAGENVSAVKKIANHLQKKYALPEIQLR